MTPDPKDAMKFPQVCQAVSPGGCQHPFRTLSELIPMSDPDSQTHEAKVHSDPWSVFLVRPTEKLASFFRPHHDDAVQRPRKYPCGVAGYNENPPGLGRSRGPVMSRVVPNDEKSFWIFPVRRSRLGHLSQALISSPTASVFSKFLSGICTPSSLGYAGSWPFSDPVCGLGCAGWNHGGKHQALGQGFLLIMPSN